MLALLSPSVVSVALIVIAPFASAPPSGSVVPIESTQQRIQGDWSTFVSIGNDVSVSFSQVNATTWTWRFQNDGTTTITDLRFKYTDKDGTHKDLVPLNILPGKYFGGWSAFTASTQPTIEIVSIKRK